jgi:L-lactate dehydrogenase complex protein LldG
MTARDEILGRIRSALADRPRPDRVQRSYRTAGAATGGEPEAVGTGGVQGEGLPANGVGADGRRPNDVGGASRPADGVEGEERLDLLADRLIDYKATVHRATAETAAGVIATALAERGATRVVVPAGFPADLLSGLDPTCIVRDEPVLASAELDATDGVLTTSTLAIAETGTIVLDAGPGQGRRAVSLVPDYHLCVVRAADVVRGVPEGIDRLGPTAATKPLTWISGPSATSDIELQRVEGVHGPRTLVVVLIS